MQSDLHQRCYTAGAALTVSAFPLDGIRERLARVPVAEPRKRGLSVALAASFSLIAVAAAAAVVTQSHIDFTRSGGMVLSSHHASNRAISSDNDISRAAEQMNFHVTLPSGLPAGSKPVRLYVGDHDVMAITYDLPGAWRASHHLAWVFLANPASMSEKRQNAPYGLRTGHRMSTARWEVDGERVVVVSNGLTADEVAHMKTAMGGN